MAGTIYARSWAGRGLSGRKVRKTSYGYSLFKDGRRIRRHDATWSREDAQRALAAAQLGLDGLKAGTSTSTPGMTLGEAIERYLALNPKKRELRDRVRLDLIRSELGADTPLAQITASRISEYKAKRMKVTVRRDGQDRPLSASTLNRELSAIRHLLRQAAEEWEIIEKIPRIRLGKEPQARVRWLTPEERVRLLAACAASRNKDLAGIVVVALETGMRHGEIMGLTWDRIDFSRGVIRLEITKSGRRREVPMRRAVYDVLASRSGERVGRVWLDKSIRKCWETAVAAAKLEAPFRFHDTRHDFASWYVMRGGDILTLSKILGHAKVSMTEKYAHLAGDHLRAQMERTETPQNVSQPSHGVQSATERLVSAYAPVAQLDRASDF